MITRSCSLFRIAILLSKYTTIALPLRIPELVLLCDYLAVVISVMSSGHYLIFYMSQQLTQQSDVTHLMMTRQMMIPFHIIFVLFVLKTLTTKLLIFPINFCQSTHSFTLKVVSSVIHAQQIQW